MVITISNKLYIKEVPQLIRDYALHALKIPNPKYIEALQQGRRTWGIMPEIFLFNILPDESYVFPRGVLKEIIDLCDTNNIPFSIVDNRQRYPPFTMNAPDLKYRPYQKDAIVKLLQTGTNGILKSPPGSGKTVMGISLIPILGQPTLWLTHTKALSRQTAKRIVKFLPEIKEKEIGIIGDSKWKLGDKITIGLIQTLARKDNFNKLLALRDKFGLAIVDEVHHSPAETFYTVISNLNPYYLYGLTATPYRRDKLEEVMFKTIGDISSDVSTDEIMKTGGIIMPTVVYRIIKSPIIEIIDFTEVVSSYIVGNYSRNKIIVDDVIREAKAGNIGIVLSDRKEHCEELFELIKSRWGKTGIATGDYSSKHIDEQTIKLENREITILVTTASLLGEGFDVNILNRAFLACPFRNKTKTEQLIGRIQRSAEGKTDSMVYDYVDHDVVVLRSQFYSKNKEECRYRTYSLLGLTVKQLEA